MSVHAARVRARLWNPPNAVCDTEIDLGRQSNAAREALRLKMERARIEAEQIKPPASPPKQKRQVITYPAPVQIPIFDTERIADRTVPIESFSKLRHIQITVAEAYGFGRVELISRRRGGILIRPRQIAMYLCTILTIRSLPEIGRVFNRDHTTILHARDKIARLRKTDARLNAEITALIEKLGVIAEDLA